LNKTIDTIWKNEKTNKTIKKKKHHHHQQQQQKEVVILRANREHMASFRMLNSLQVKNAM